MNKKRKHKNTIKHKHQLDQWNRCQGHGRAKKYTHQIIAMT